MENGSLPGLPGDRYVIDSLIGRGGMGRVWKARDVVLDRYVAIKETTTPPGLSADERDRLLGRALREARAIARIDHPNVVRVHDVLAGLIVMEYVPGHDLRHLLDRGPIPPELAADVAVGVLRALQAAHAGGVLHRDVKPGNIILSDQGRVVLTDFGIAKAVEYHDSTHTGHIIGTPEYLAPERARGDEPTAAADLWSLGVTLYEATTGTSPFHRDGPLPTMYAVVNDEVSAPAAAGRLGPVIDGFLVKDPARRMDAPTALARLEDAPNQRRPRRLLAAVLVLALAVAGAVAGALYLREDRDPNLAVLQAFAGEQPNVEACAAIGPRANQLTRRQCVSGDGVETVWIRYATAADRDAQRDAGIKLHATSPESCQTQQGATPDGVRGHYVEYTYRAKDDGKQYVSVWWDDDLSNPDNTVALNLRRVYDPAETDPAAPLRERWRSWHNSFT